MLAVRDRGENRVLGDARAADRLDDDLDGRIGDGGDRVAYDGDVRPDNPARAFAIAGADPGDFDAAAGAPCDLLAIPFENAVRPAADRSEPEQAQLDGRLRAQA